MLKKKKKETSLTHTHTLLQSKFKEKQWWKDQRNVNEQQWSVLIDSTDKCGKTGTYLQYRPE